MKIVLLSSSLKRLDLSSFALEEIEYDPCPVVIDNWAFFIGVVYVSATSDAGGSHLTPVQGSVLESGLIARQDLPFVQISPSGAVLLLMK